MVECETEYLKVISSILILDKRAFHHGLAQNIQPQHSSHDAYQNKQNKTRCGDPLGCLSAPH
jgi:hypothetical protein